MEDLLCQKFGKYQNKQTLANNKESKSNIIKSQEMLMQLDAEIKSIQLNG